MIESVLAVCDDDLYDVERRMQALGVFADDKASSDLSQVFKRVRKLLEKANQVNGKIAIDVSLFQESVEETLYHHLNTLDEKTKPLLLALEYDKALVTMAAIKPDVDAFFEKVMVMADDEAIKHNRLSLLSALQQQFLKVADISHLE